jgi:2-C-methyl-D-erythritol 4-phosphate cytidylyltransferase
MSICAVIPAGGAGRRFASTVPKQFVKLDGVPIIIHTLNVFDRCRSIDRIVLASHALWIEELKNLIEKYNIKKVHDIIPGGEERYISVLNALSSAAALNSDYIMVHDAVRPFASDDLITRTAEACSESGAAIPALPPKETLKEVSEDRVVKTLRRCDIVSVQTPQAFRRDILVKAYEDLPEDKSNITDDASLVERAGYEVRVIRGEERNIKITTKFDIEIAEMFLKS